MSPLAKFLRLLALTAIVVLSLHRAGDASHSNGSSLLASEACERGAPGWADESPPCGECDTEPYALDVAEPLLSEAESEGSGGSAPCDDRRAGGEDELPVGALLLASPRVRRAQAQFGGDVARGPPALVG